MTDLLLLLAMGSLAGLTAGLLGIGGGLVVVPALVLVFQGQGVAPDSLMHVAIGTSLATIVVTSLSSIRAHHQRGAVAWELVVMITPGIVVGVLFGVWLAAGLSGEVLRITFGIFVLLVALRMLLGGQTGAHRSLPKASGVRLVGVVIGVVSSLVGIGGGTLSVPFLTWCSVEMRRAVATSAAIGLPIAVVGALGYLISGWDAPARPLHSLGYINLPAFFSIVVASVLFAPLGARLAHSMPPLLLKRVFAVFLIIVGIKLLLDL